jgi:hypothetical protein
MQGNENFVTVPRRVAMGGHAQAAIPPLVERVARRIMDNSERKAKKPRKAANPRNTTRVVAVLWWSRYFAVRWCSNLENVFIAWSQKQKL